MVNRNYEVIDNGIELYPSSVYKSSLINLEDNIQIGIYLNFDQNGLPEKPLVLRVFFSPVEDYTTDQNKTFYIFPKLLHGNKVYKEIPITTGQYFYFEIDNTDKNIDYIINELQIQRVRY